MQPGWTINCYRSQMERFIELNWTNVESFEITWTHIKLHKTLILFGNLSIYVEFRSVEVGVWYRLRRWYVDCSPAYSAGQ